LAVDNIKLALIKDKRVLFFVLQMILEDKKEQNNKQAWWQPAMLMFAKLSGWIAAPVLIGVFFGKWLDRKYGTEPWLFLASAGVAFLISMVGLVIEAKKEMGKIEKESKKDKKAK